MSTVVLPLGKHKVEIDRIAAAILHPHPHQAVPRFFGYARASLDVPYPAAVQEQELRQLALYQGVEWGRLRCDEATMGKLPLIQRTSGYGLISHLKPGDHVGMTRLNRAFPNQRQAVKQIDDWIEQGVIVHVLDFDLHTNTDDGRTIAVLRAAAQNEGSVLRERFMGRINSPRVKALLASRPSRGKAVGRAGYGFRLKGARGRKVLVEDLEERAIMALIVTWHDQDNLSWKHISPRLLLEILRHRILSRKGRSWSADCCRRAYLAELELRAQANAKMTAPSLPASDGSSPTEPSRPKPST
jgi:hypothetical protein